MSSQLVELLPLVALDGKRSVGCHITDDDIIVMNLHAPKAGVYLLSLLSLHDQRYAPSAKQLGVAVKVFPKKASVGGLLVDVRGAVWASVSALRWLVFDDV